MATWRARVLDGDEALLYQSCGFASEREARAWVLGIVAVLVVGRDGYDMWWEPDNDGGLVTATVWDLASEA